MLKIALGAQIDGFAGILADTIVVPEKEGETVVVEGRKADVLMAAWLASEAAIRLVKPGNKNFAVTDAVNKVAEAFGCKALQGMRLISANVNCRDVVPSAESERYCRKEADNLKPNYRTEEWN